MKSKPYLAMLVFAVAVSLALLAIGCASHKTAPAPAGADTEIPAIANLAGVAIGYSTQEDVARQWGEGKVITGGHPNSGRVWRINGTDWVSEHGWF